MGGEVNFFSYQLMGFNIRRFVDLLLLPLYGYYLKLAIYLKNQQVKAGFGGEPSVKPVMLTAGLIVVVLSFLLLFWILINNIPSPEKTENIIIPPSLKNKQEMSKQSLTTTKTIETNRELSEEIEPLPFVKKDEEKVEKDEIEVSDEIEARDEKEEDESIGAVIAEIYMRVLADNVNIRMKPSLESGIIARLEEGYVIRKLGSQGDWIFADPGGNFKGWVYYDLLGNATVDEYESWGNNPNQPALMELAKNDLDNPDNLEKEKKKIEKFLHLWKTAWEEKDVEKYMSFYSKSFTKSDYNWEGYKKYKKNIFHRSGTISIEIKNIKISWDTFVMSVSFIQKYQSGTINSTTGKLLHFHQENESWKIVRESLVNRN